MVWREAILSHADRLLSGKGSLSALHASWSAREIAPYFDPKEEETDTNAVPWTSARGFAFSVWV